MENQPKITEAELRLFERYRDVFRDVKINTEAGLLRFREIISATADLHKELQGIDEALEDLADGYSLLKSNIDDIFDTTKAERHYGILKKRKAELEAQTKKDTTEQQQAARKSLQTFTSSLGELNKFRTSSNNLLRKANEYTRTAIEGTATQAEGLKLQDRIRAEIAAMQQMSTALSQKEEELTKEVVVLLKEKIKSVTDELEKAEVAAQLQTGEVKAYEKKLGLIKQIPGLLKKIPVLGSFLDLENFETDLKTAIDSGKTAAEAGAQLAEKSIKAALSSPTVQLALGVAMLKKSIDILTTAGKSYSKTVSDIGKQYMVSSEYAKLIYNTTRDASQQRLAELGTQKDFIQAQQDINDEMGTSALLSNKFLAEQVNIVTKLGLSNAEAAKLSLYSIRTGKSQNDILKAIGKSNVGLLSNKKVLQEALGVTGELAARYKNNIELIAKGVVQAQKLGINLQQAKDMASGLLDFEQSLTSQMEAEVLLGRSLNLDRARALAFQGKYDEAAKEMLSNARSLEELQSMGPIALEALARSLNMTSDQLTDAVVKQTTLNKLVGEQKTYIDELSRKGEKEKADKVLALLTEGKTLDQAKAKVDAAEQLQASTARLRESWTRLMEGPGEKLIKGVGWMVDKVASIGALGGGVVGAAGLTLLVVGSIALVIKGLFAITGGLAALTTAMATLPARIATVMGGGMLMRGGMPMRAGIPGLAANTAMVAGGNATAQNTVANIIPTTSTTKPPISSTPSPKIPTNQVPVSSITPQPTWNTTSTGSNTATVNNAPPPTPSSQPSKPSGKPGFLQRLNPIQFVKNINPAQVWRNIGGFKGFMKIAKTNAAIAAIFEAFFANSDIHNIIASSKTKDELYQRTGERVAGGLGSVIGAGLGAAGGTLIGMPFLGGMAGHYLGGKLGTWIAQSLGASGLGKGVIDIFYKKEVEAAGLHDGSASKYSLESADTGGVITQAGIAKVDKGEVYLGKDTRETFIEMVKTLKEHTAILASIRDKELTINTDRLAYATARSTVMSPGNLLNSSARLR
jgi:hypothetical protein